MPLSLGYLEKLHATSEEGAGALLAVLNEEDLITIGDEIGERSLFTKKELRDVSAPVSTSSVSVSKFALLFANRVRFLPNVIKSKLAAAAFKLDLVVVNNAMLLAAREGNLPAIRKILEIPGVIITSESLNELLYSAARDGHQSIVEFVFDKCGDKIATRTWNAAFCCAARDVHQGVMEFVSDKQGDKINNKTWNKAFIYAVTYDHQGVMRFIFDKRGDKITTKTWDVAFSSAPYLGHQGAMELILGRYGDKIIARIWNKIFKNAAGCHQEGMIKSVKEACDRRSEVATDDVSASAHVGADEVVPVGASYVDALLEERSNTGAGEERGR